MTSPEPSPPERPELPLWAPFAVMAVVYVVISSLQAAVYGIVKASDPSIHTYADLPLSVSIVFTVIQEGVLILGSWLALRMVLGHAGPADLGLRRVTRVGRAVAAAAAVYVVYLAVTYVLAVLFGNPPDQELVKDIKREESTAVLVGFAVLTCLLAPFAEELFFRGFMFRAFAGRIGPVWGSLLGGLVFGLVHAPNPPLALAALAVLGVGLCVLYWRIQSIIPCMALHALNNSITFGVTTKLHDALFAGLVIGSVGLIIAGASALSARPAVTA